MLTEQWNTSVQLLNEEWTLEQAHDFIKQTEELKTKYASQLVYTHLDKLSDAAVKGSLNNCSLLDEPVGKVATRLYRTLCREVVDISLREQLWSELKTNVAVSSEYIFLGMWFETIKDFSQRVGEYFGNERKPESSSGTAAVASSTKF